MPIAAASNRGDRHAVHVVAWVVSRHNAGHQQYCRAPSSAFNKALYSLHHTNNCNHFRHFRPFRRSCLSGGTSNGIRSSSILSLRYTGHSRCLCCRLVAHGVYFGAFAATILKSYRVYIPARKLMPRFLPDIGTLLMYRRLLPCSERVRFAHSEFGQAISSQDSWAEG